MHNEESPKIVRNIIRTTTDLLAFGEITSNFENTPKGPVDPSTLDLALIAQVLVVCFQAIPMEETDPLDSRYQYTTPISPTRPPPPLLEELRDVVDMVISVSERWISRSDYRAPGGYSEESGWKEVSKVWSGLDSAETRHLPSRWEDAFTQLHQSTLSKSGP